MRGILTATAMALAMTPAMSAPAVAEVSELATYGDWTAYMAVEGDAWVCGIDAVPSYGQRVAIRVSPEFGVAFEFYDDDWQLSQEDGGTVAVQFDNGQAHVLDVFAVAPQIVRALISDGEHVDMDVITRFQSAWTMTVDFPRAPVWRLSLHGSHAAFSVLVECASALFDDSGVATSPF